MSCADSASIFQYLQLCCNAYCNSTDIHHLDSEERKKKEIIKSMGKLKRFFKTKCGKKNINYYKTIAVSHHTI